MPLRMGRSSAKTAIEVPGLPKPPFRYSPAIRAG